MKRGLDMKYRATRKFFKEDIGHYIRLSGESYSVLKNKKYKPLDTKEQFKQLEYASQVVYLTIQIIYSIPLPYRDVLLLNYVDDIPTKDIPPLIGKSYRTVHTYKNKALKMFDDAFKSRIQLLKRP